MCRLVLMNDQAVHFLEPYLPYLLGHLESALGGDGNGVGALWMEKRAVRVRKGLMLSATQAAKSLQLYTSHGADWLLFHTRRATSSKVADRHCHPFQRGRFVLAHNGHDSLWVRLGRSLAITDSESITQAWARVRFPLTELSLRSGVFIGFSQDHPFVVKGQPSSSLAVAWHQDSGAILFASELPPWLAEGVFDQVLSVDRIAWFGRELDPETFEARPYDPYPKYRTEPLPTVRGYSSLYVDWNPLWEWRGDDDEEYYLRGRLVEDADEEDEDPIVNQRQIESLYPPR